MAASQSVYRPEPIVRLTVFCEPPSFADICWVEGGKEDESTMKGKPDGEKQHRRERGTRAGGTLLLKPGFTQDGRSASVCLYGGGSLFSLLASPALVQSCLTKVGSRPSLWSLYPPGEVSYSSTWGPGEKGGVWSGAPVTVALERRL